MPHTGYYHEAMIMLKYGDLASEVAQAELVGFLQSNGLQADISDSDIKSGARCQLAYVHSIDQPHLHMPNPALRTVASQAIALDIILTGCSGSESRI